jgi:putative transposase
MANTYSEVYIQFVFAVQGRRSLIPPCHREELHKFISGIAERLDQKMLAIFAMPDHLHLFAGMTPQLSHSDFMRDIKAGSSKFINDKQWLNTKFNWQSGFGSFSYSKSQIDRVVKYILNQEEHHKKMTFMNEYISLLKKFEVEYNERYLFEWIDQ